MHPRMKYFFFPSKNEILELYRKVKVVKGESNYGMVARSQA